MKLRSESLALGACLLVLVGVGVCTPLSAAPSQKQVYTWVDKNGVRHYSDRPGSPNAVLISLQALPAATSSFARAATAPRPASAPVPHTVPAAPAASASPAERAARCETLRQQVQQLQSARRVQVTEQGKTHFVTGDELVKFRQQMQQRMQAACNPPSS